MPVLIIVEKRKFDVSDKEVTAESSTILGHNGEVIEKVLDLKSMSPRLQVCYELLQTETNYVGILHTIITVRVQMYCLRI